MTAIIFYFLVSNISFLIGYILYRIFLRKETDFKSIRYYLLLVVIGSLVLPMVNFELPSNLLNILPLGKQTNLENAGLNFPVWSLTPGMPSADASNYIQILIIIYFSAVFLLCSRMLFQISTLGVCIYKSNKVNKENYTLVFNNQFTETFSFFRWIFVNVHTKNTEGMEVIIAHEAAHCRQRHSIDVILAELTAILFWFNPLVWKMKRAIKLNHEYLADQSVLHSGIVPSAEYQMILLNKAAEGNLFSYVSSFGGNMLKNRILMLLAAKNSAQSMSKFKVISVMICCITLVFLTTAFINVKHHETIDQPVKMKTRSAKPKVKTLQGRADEPVAVQSIPINRVTTNSKTDDPLRITVTDYKRTR